MPRTLRFSNDRLPVLRLFRLSGRLEVADAMGMKHAGLKSDEKVFQQVYTGCQTMSQRTFLVFLLVTADLRWRRQQMPHLEVEAGIETNASPVLTLCSTRMLA